MARSTEKDTLSHSENSGSPNNERTTARRGRFRRCCVRFWWLWLLILIVVVLVVVLPIIYVAYPKTARSSIDNSKIEVSSMSITKPTPNTADLALTEIFLSNSSHTATLDAFNASLYLLDWDTPFINLNIPQIKGKNGTEVTIAQQINITDLSEYTRYVETVLASEQYTMVLKGSGGLKLGSLPGTTVNYDKNISMAGLNGLKGLTIESFYLLNETLANGVNGLGKVKIPNPSVMTLELGDVELGMFVNGTSIGNATMPNLNLVPGENTVTMEATVYELVVVGLVVAGAASPNGTLAVEVKGNRTTYNGAEIPYYTDALQQTSLQVSLNVFEAQNKTVSATEGSLKRGINLLI